MRIIRKYMHNSLRNYNYLVGCEQTQQAIVIDPFDADLMLKTAADEGLKITMVINTHEHHDHVQGNLAIVEETGASVWAHENAQVPGQTHFVKANDLITFGRLSLRALFTPGHTPVHLCLLAQDEQQQVLFSGDTLFNACAGNCKNGGNVEDMYLSFVNELAHISDETLLYPGHDYMRNNLNFAQTREPENPQVLHWLAQTEELDGDTMPVMTLGQERTYNPFLRLQHPAIYQQLLSDFPYLENTPQAVFTALRRLRDDW